MQSTRKKSSNIINAFIFLLPTLLAFTLAFIIPFATGVYLSFTEFTTVSNATWVGISNYRKIFNNKDFINAFWFTSKFTVASIISVNLIAFTFASLLTRGVKGENIFRTIFFMPNLIGGIVLGYIWQLIINGFLLPYGKTISSSANFGFWGLVIMTNWQLIGYMMVIYIAGIQNIPGELIEAAEIDGATPWQVLKSIKVPMIMPSFTICLFLTLSKTFNLFDQNLALTNGAPMKKTTMLALDIFNTFYGRNGFEGVAQAKAVIFFIIVAMITFAQLAVTRDKEVEH